MTPRTLGLTGGIGMGKSTTAAMFAERGAAVWDADAAVRRLYGRGGAGVPAIAAIRPAAIREGAVDRDALKAWIAEDAEALPALDRAIHPLVAADRAAFVERADAALVVCDVPLLFESGADAGMDRTATVSVPPEVQRARVLARGTMDAAALGAILARQMTDAERRARADYVIDTTRLEAARADVARIVEEMTR